MRLGSPLLYGNLRVGTASGFESAWIKHMQSRQHLLLASEATCIVLSNLPCLALPKIWCPPAVIFPGDLPFHSFQ